jgi:hypothetical protein
MGILVYVFLAGWLVPLKPGIIKVSPDRAVAGEMLVVDVTGYNSSYLADTTQLRAWLKLTGDTVIKAQHIQAWIIAPSLLASTSHPYSRSDKRLIPLPWSLTMGLKGPAYCPTQFLLRRQKSRTQLK